MYIGLYTSPATLTEVSVAPPAVVSQLPQPSTKPTPASSTPDLQAILALTVNQVPKRDVFVILREGDILARRADLEAAGLQNFSGREETVNNQTYVSLASLSPNVSFEYNESALTLSLIVQTNLLGTTSINLGSQPSTGLVYKKDTSAFFNYAFNSSLNSQTFNNYTFFGESGLSLNGNLLYSSFSRKTDGSFMRGLTNFTLDNPDKLTRWVVGDAFASTGNLGGGLFLGGISVSREFNLNPYLIRQPTFALSGAVFTPSTVEVYVNGQRVRREDLPPGQFQFNNLVLPTGAGSTQIVIRNAFGREQVIGSPFYFSSGLLRPGLSDYSFNLGFRRNNLNSDSWNYGEPAFLGRYSQGLTNSLTLGGRLEAASNLISGGPTITAALPFGAIELAAAASMESGLPGSAASLAYSYTGGRFGFGGSVRVFSDYYANASLKDSDDRPRLETNAFVSANISRDLTLGLQYANSNFRDSEALLRLRSIRAANSADRGTSDRLSLLSTIRLTDRASLFINASRISKPAQAATNEIFLGLNYSLGGNTNAYLSQQIGERNITILSVQKSPPVGEGFGYRLQLQPSEGVPGNARLE
jgi:outer membrane usher protein